MLVIAKVFFPAYVVLIGMLLMACGSEKSPDVTPVTPPSTINPITKVASPNSQGAEGGLSWMQVKSYAYQLQKINLAALGRSNFDLFIIDYSSDGSEAGRFNAQQISTLQHSSNGPKQVLAYLSIGEAEDYRFYWQANWDANHDGKPDALAPAWLGSSNPEWPGNYKVKYWDPQWQALLFGSPNSYLDKILDAGFNGVYLDIIDAYQYWGPKGESGLNRASAEQEMVALVKRMAEYARVVRGKPNFGIFPQNGEELAAHSDYVQVVSGIGKEDTWYDGNKANPAADVRDTLANLDIFQQAGKLVLTTDYVTTSSLIDAFYAKALAKRYIPYATVRNLDQLTINPGHNP